MAEEQEKKSEMTIRKRSKESSRYIISYRDVMKQRQKLVFVQYLECFPVAEE